MEHIEMVYVKIVVGLFSIIGVLVGVLWNTHNNRLCRIEKIQENRPFPQIETDLAEIKNDIKWVKGYLFNEVKNKENL